MTDYIPSFLKLASSVICWRPNIVAALFRQYKGVMSSSVNSLNKQIHSNYN